MKNKKGFTLIELLIVIAIIAILAASVIMLLSPGERMQEARESTRESHMIAIGQAIHLAVVDKVETCTDGEATPAFDEVCRSVQHVVETCTDNAASGGLQGYFHDNCATLVGMSSAPFDPLLGADNFYQIINSGASRVKVWAHADVGSDETEWYDATNAKTF